jgi:ribosome maturation factor RimP
VSEDVAAALASPLADLGLVPVDATTSTAGGRRVLRVLVDRDVSGLHPADGSSRVAPLSLDEVAAAATVVGSVLDDSDLMGDRAYTLEVSSPGVGRPISGYAAFRRVVGRLVDITLASGERLTARVLVATPQELTVEVPAARKAPAVHRTLALADVRSGAVQVEFGRAAEPEDAGRGDATAGANVDDMGVDDVDADDMDAADTDAADTDAAHTEADEEEWSHSCSAPAEEERA